MASVFESIERLLTERGANYRVMRHEPVFTSQEAAQVRGAPLSSGAKALVCKADDRHVMIVLPADRKLDSRGVRRAEKLSGLRFATREEVAELTGLAPGSIPPFGSLFGLPTWCDERLADEPEINFNAGDHAISVCMTYADYARVENPRIGRFAE